MVALAASLSAQIAKPDFSNVSDMSLLGSAAQEVNDLRITDTLANQTGNAWHLSQQGVLAGFETTFDFRITPGPVLAEGMAFIIQNAAAGSNAVGGTIWRLGYSNIPNSIAIEIDTFNDGFINDTSSNELSVHTRGLLGNDENENFSIGRTTPAILLSDGNVHTMMIRYVPGLLEVFIDNLVTPLLSINYDLLAGGTYLTGGSAGGLSLPNGLAWVGFSGTTGAGNLNEEVDILNWTFTSNSPLDPCFSGNVDAANGDPVDALTVNGSRGDFFRHVTTDTFLPLSFEMATPPANTGPANFIIVGQIGAADGSEIFSTVFGDVCFPVDVAVHLPTTFTLVNTFPTSSPGLLPAIATPWNVSLPLGLSFPTVFSLQGAVEDDSASTGVAITNAVIVEVVVAQAPTLANIVPLSAPAGDPVTISGTGFNPNLSLVVDGNTVVPTSVSATQIVFAYPAGVACDSTVMISNPDGQSLSSAFNPTPVVINTVNSTGPAAGGTTFIVLGTGFSPGSAVTIGGSAATVLTATAATLIISTPPGVTGSANVVITTPGGCSVTTTYTYL